MRNSNHVVADLLLLGSSVRTQTYDDESGTHLTLITTPEFVHCRNCRGYLSLGVAHDSSLSPRASLSRIAISSGIRGETSTLASASLR